MNNSILSDYCPRTNIHTFDIVEGLKVTVTETANPFGLPVEALFSMAARINKKRSFLFVSKLLGKHIPVDPYTPLLAGAALALLLQRELGDGGTVEPERQGGLDSLNGLEHLGDLNDLDDLDDLLQLAMYGLLHPEHAGEVYRRLCERKLVPAKRLLFIGYAETATALGHSMYAMFAEGASYIHTTRENIPELESAVSFEEEHSHAVDHLCYALERELLSGDEPAVLVDDEITTGNTAINTIRDLHSKFPRREYVVASLLDWRDAARTQAYRDLEAELGITIRAISLLQGTIEVEGTPLLQASSGRSARERQAPVVVTQVHDGMERLYVSSADSAGEVNPAPYMRWSGRFGLSSADNAEVDRAARVAAEQLRGLREGSRALVLGVGEFMYLPMRIAAEMGPGVAYQSSTRSPIHPEPKPDYGVNSAEGYPSAVDPGIRNYLYNISPGQYDDIFVLLERGVPEERIRPMTDILRGLAAGKVHLVVLAPAADYRKVPLAEPSPIGSYPAGDVVFLLKDLGGVKLERGTEERERAIQSGVHYSEMLPAEALPAGSYMELYSAALERNADKVAMAAATVAEGIVACRGLEHTVLVSLARAGTPAGILIKRYIASRYGVSLPHYSISIIRGKGIDENAILYILRQHGFRARLQFIDGWTGKGAITRVLTDACAKMRAVYGIRLDDELAVLADPGHCSGMFGTREDYLIPNACLNATASGLISRTVLREDLIGPGDFHGAKFYGEWRDQDVSNSFIEAVVPHFDAVAEAAKAQALERLQHPPEVSWRGLEAIRRIQAAFALDNINLIKPGVGETTRVLLRRVPWKILIDAPENPHLQYILRLAADKGVPVEVFPGLGYACCGIIRPLKGDDE
ncbi:PELOTA RNA binding domain-containing protein [Paenibacillus sp. NFR01]|nr:PELOTA RNA binding domain-containing protein [Paenibacillus sp. NFR01]